MADDSTPRIVETRTAAPNVLAVVLETAKDETGNPSTPDVLDLDPAKWTVSGIRPTAVHRHSVPYDALPAIPGRDDRFPMTMHHRIYLQLTAPLQAGQTYQIATPYGPTSLVFDPRKTYCESLKVNVAGYSALSTARRAVYGVYRGDGGSLKFDGLPVYEVIDEKSGKVVFSDTATYAGDETTKGVGSGQFVYHLPLDKVPPGGPYYVSLPSCGRSRSFGIGGQASRDLATIAFKGLYHQRCGIALEKPFTEHTRAACHARFADTRAKWSSDGFINVPAGMATKPWAGGHHDAGDFDLRPQHTIIARILLTTFEALKPRFKDGQFGLPESGKGVPDFLSEAMWAVLAWETLQIIDTTDPKFGGVRAGVESSRHPQYGIDSAANDHTGIHGTWDVDDEVTALCAGIFAHASRMIRTYDSARATALLKRAENAYQYAAAKNALGPGLASTVYASCQMYLATGIQSYHDTFKAAVTSVVLSGGSWPNQYLPDNPQAKGTTEDFFSYLLPIPGVVDATIVTALKSQVFRLADAGGYQEVKIDTQPYSNPATKSVGWGAWTSSRLALLMGYASVLSTDAVKRQKYLNHASLLGDHTLGLNGSGRCFMTGPWPDSPRSPLHLDSWFTKSGSSDGVTQDHVGKPKGNVPGIVVYGPSQGRSGTAYERSAMDKLSPDKLPVAEDDADAWPAVSRAEFSTWELSVEAAALYGGFLYDATTDTGATEPVPQPQDPPMPPVPPTPPLPLPANTLVNKIGPHGETVGAIVHYVRAGEVVGEKPRIIAAMVTQVNDDGTVALKLMFPAGVKDYPAEKYSETYAIGRWSWPAKATTPVPVPVPTPVPGPTPTDRSIVVPASEFRGTAMQALTPGMIGIREAMTRADAGRTPRTGAQIAFTYRGPSKETVPLTSGEMRRQIGLKLRSANTCNVVYVMWWITPTTGGIHVSVKSNPGKSEHSQCGDGGYINLSPTAQRAVHVIRVGERRTLAARITGTTLSVMVDSSIVAWTGTLPREAFAFDGPVGIRSDNGEFDLEYRALT